jgi:hypothetical protein
MSLQKVVFARQLLMKNSSDGLNVDLLAGLLSYVDLDVVGRQFLLGAEGDDGDASVVVNVFAVLPAGAVMMMRGRGSESEGGERIVVLFPVLLLLLFFIGRSVVLLFDVTREVGAFVERRERGERERERREGERELILLVEAS